MLRLRTVCVLVASLALPALVWAQVGAPAPGAQAEVPKDPLGRETPRGTLLGFMRAAREGNLEVASQYLGEGPRGQAAQELARQLFVVLDSRLPARLNELSNRPEGALANPLKPDQDIVGTISAGDSTLDLVVERVNRPTGRIWLFSRETLASIPDVYDEIDLVSVDRFLPRALARYRVAGIRLFDWFVLLVVVPLCYRLLGLLNPLYRLLMALQPRKAGTSKSTSDVPGFVRLLLLAVGIRWLLADIELSFVERRFWSASATLFLITAIVWMSLLLTAFGERYLRVRLRDTGEITALLRLGRRMAEVLVVTSGGLVTLYYFGVDPTAALAGLGIGGIAVALAAQKTLENVIGGLSIIFDKAVRVGDFLKLGEIVGMVDYIGLRSTRIRTLDRTILSVPNGQLANVNIETLSARDKFWFRHIVALRYETTSETMRSVIDGIRSYLLSHAAVDTTDSVRARLFRLGPFSFDIEVFAYVRATDWERFLEVQQELLLGIIAIVERAGATIALPSQTLHLLEPSRVARLNAQGDAAESR